MAYVSSRKPGDRISAAESEAAHVIELKRIGVLTERRLIEVERIQSPSVWLKQIDLAVIRADIPVRRLRRAVMPDISAAHVIALRLDEILIRRGVVALNEPRSKINS